MDGEVLPVGRNDGPEDVLLWCEGLDVVLVWFDVDGEDLGLRIGPGVAEFWMDDGGSGGAGADGKLDDSSSVSSEPDSEPDDMRRLVFL